MYSLKSLIISCFKIMLVSSVRNDCFCLWSAGCYIFATRLHCKESWRLQISYIWHFETTSSKFYFSVLTNILHGYGYNTFLLMNSCLKRILHGISLFYTRISVTLHTTCGTEEMMFNFTGTSLTVVYHSHHFSSWHLSKEEWMNDN